MNLKVQKCHDLSISSKKSPPTVAQRHRANRVSMWRCHAATEEPNEKTRGGTLTFNDPLRMFCRWNFISLSGMVPQKIGIFLSSFLLIFSNLHYILKDFGELFNHHLVCQLHCLFGQSFDRVLGTILGPEQPEPNRHKNRPTAKTNKLDLAGGSSLEWTPLICWHLTNLRSWDRGIMSQYCCLICSLLFGDIQLRSMISQRLAASAWQALPTLASVFAPPTRKAGQLFGTAPDGIINLFCWNFRNNNAENREMPQRWLICKHWNMKCQEGRVYYCS